MGFWQYLPTVTMFIYCVFQEHRYAGENGHSPASLANVPCVEKIYWNGRIAEAIVFCSPDCSVVLSGLSNGTRFISYILSKPAIVA